MHYRSENVKLTESKKGTEINHEWRYTGELYSDIHILTS
jgi:hypothetical protein